MFLDFGKIILFFVAFGMLTACGGSGSSGSGGSGDGTTPDLRGEPLPGVDGVSDDRRNFGIGPAFRNQSPDIDDLPASSETTQNGIRVRSGFWRDPQGRDGSHNAADVVRFIKAFQTQEYWENGPEADLVVGMVGQKTLRMLGATRAERALVRAALSEINTSLPWNKRILLGPNLSRQISIEDVPNNEIHLYFTNGKASWPDTYEEPEGSRILGIGGTNGDRESFTVLGGFAFIDRQAIGSDANLKRHTIAHEILHAYGIGAHVNPDEFPNSIMTPSSDNYEDIQPVFLSIDGEALLAVMRITPGTRVADITPSDLGPWTDTAFHLLGYAELDDANDDLVQFGVGKRNGLAKPWAYGPVPATRLQDNPALSGSASATWNGGLLGFSGNGRTVAGNAQIRIDLADLDGSADFSNLESWTPNTHPGQPGSGRTWGDGDLGYSIEVVHGNIGDGFVSTFAPGDDPGVVSGAFVGAAHEGAAGILEHPDLSAAFGAKR